MVAGPWYHGGWHAAEGNTLGPLSFSGHKTALEFRQRVEAPFFRHYLHESGDKPSWKVTTFQTGSNEWKSYTAWPPPTSKTTSLYLHADGTLSFNAPAKVEPVREYVSDPAKPVPYVRRPVRSDDPAQWQYWLTTDQRHVDGRPDVLTYETMPLDKPVQIAGAPIVNLFASTSGTDSDWVVKLIDVYPDVVPSDVVMGGYELPIGMDIFRGRYRESFEHPSPIPANKVQKYRFDLPPANHVFLPGHRIMVQVQSTWFPLYDRNPQTYVPNIFFAKPADYRKATQRVYLTGDTASSIELPVVPVR